MVDAIFTGEERGGSFEPIPAGRYPVEVDDAEEMTSRKGDPMIKLIFKVLEGEYTGRIIYNYIVFNEGGMFSARKAIEALGVEFVKGQAVSINPDQLVGKTLEVDGKIDPYEGREINAVKFAGYYPREELMF